jgi:uncharacterized protein YeaO (DUF488 family)
MNKREYKKAVTALGSSVCVEFFNISCTTPGINKEEVDAAISQVWNAMIATTNGANRSFGKGPKKFEDRKAFRKAKNQYFTELFKSLSENFSTQIDEALKIVNKAKNEAK